MPVRVKPGGAICNTQISVLPPLSSVFRTPQRHGQDERRWKKKTKVQIQFDGPPSLCVACADPALLMEFPNRPRSAPSSLIWHHNAQSIREANGSLDACT